MKRKWIMTIIAVALSVTACGPMYEYRGLDGMWQLRQITYDEDGRSEQWNDLYFSFQKHIINIRRLSHGSYFGSFKYTDDSIHVCINGATQEAMKAYGMNDTIQSFRVEKLGDGKLTLKSDYARLEFRDY